LPQAIGDQTIQAAYGRKITGRLALSLTGGPEITTYRIPIGTNGKTRHWEGAGSAAVTYAFSRGSVSLNYLHGLTSGSGVFVGATTDQITGNVTRKLSRVWTGSANIGYARNRNAGTAPGLTALGVINQNFNSIYAGASAARPLGRNANFSLGYTGYVETSSSTICAGTNCGSNFTTHQFTVGLSWHARPFVLR
jgi:hypothetical protein